MNENAIYEKVLRAKREKQKQKNKIIIDAYSHFIFGFVLMVSGIGTFCLFLVTEILKIPTALPLGNLIIEVTALQFLSSVGGLILFTVGIAFIIESNNIFNGVENAEG